MRNGQNNNKRMRGRNRRGHNPMTRVYESNGPDVKIRGTAHHIAEKYAQLARDALSSGDPVGAESYLQHAEHYYRMIMAAQAQFAQQNPHHQQQPYQRPDMDGRDDLDEEGDGDGAEQQQPQQNGQSFQAAQNQQQMHRPQPQHQPQPNIQQPYQRRDENDGSLPAFITGGGQPQTNGGEGDQGERHDRGDRGDRFGRRRRRFRPRGPGEQEQRGEGASDMGGGDFAKQGE
jgi:hypothetical protein